ncbi:MAG: ATP-dependent protease [Dehalococcoidia bacterium]|nr:ATP-dependent protease [Dehalococcoidia bacterium]
MASQAQEVAAEALRYVCNPDELGFESTQEVEPAVGTVGQDRAQDAVTFGLEIGTQGYNLFVVGVPGTGRSTTVLSHVERLAKAMPTPSDWIYVHNFQDSYRPRAIKLPPGRGAQLRRELDLLVDQCRREIPRAFDSDSYQQRRQQTMTQLDRRREQLYGELSEKAKQRGLSVQFSPSGVATVPLVEGRPMTPEEYAALADEARDRIRDLGESLQEHILAFMKAVRDAEQTTLQEIRKLDRDSALFAIGHLVEQVAATYEDTPDVVAFLEQIQEDMVEHLDAFRPQPDAAGQAQAQAMFGGPPRPPQDPTFRYRVNLLVSHEPNGGAPVVIEHNPTYYNLAGRIDYQAQFGTMSTDFRMIKPGALHRANGGFLILEAKDVLINAFSWEALKRAIDNRETTIENIGEAMSLVPMVTLRPEPIPLEVKVILVGNPLIYNILFHQDEDFRKLFKVKADFDVEMERTPETMRVYAGFVRCRVEQDSLLHFHKSGVAKVIEYGSRLLENQRKLATRFSDVADVVAEASFWAKKAGNTLVMGEHVDKALHEKEFRSSLNRDKVHEIINEGVINVSTEGLAVGQINGLSVLDSGDYIFGAPSRITAAVSLGTNGVFNIEREIEMSGKIHSKGVLILSSYLAHRYAQDRPLSLNASLTFEQLYNEVDGDSASSTELYCLLSALCDLPLRQDIAVTGSVNQRGEVQAVGGVQYKIEGFFDVCKAKGLTGTQGVMIPATNLTHLMLRDDIVEAVAKGQFHIFTARHIDEGIALLTGVPAGELQPDGLYPEGSVNGLVQQRLWDYAERLRMFNQADGHGDPEAPASQPVDGDAPA